MANLIQKEFNSPPPRPEPGAPPIARTETNGWYTLAPGIWELPLNGDIHSFQRTMLQWYEPNAASPVKEVIAHEYIEEVCLLEGVLTDLTLDQSWGLGSYAYRLPGMKHGPYKASADGCLMYVKLVPAS